MHDTLLSSPVELVCDLGSKFRIQNPSAMNKRELVDSIIRSIQDIILLKYKPKTKEEFKYWTKITLDSIMP